MEWYYSVCGAEEMLPSNAETFNLGPCIIVELTVAQLLKLFGFPSRTWRAAPPQNYVPGLKIKTSESTATLGWSQRLAGMTKRSIDPGCCREFADLRRQLSTKTNIKRPNLTCRPRL